MGPRTFQQTCREICLLLKDPRQPVVTTFFDFYGLPSNSAKGWEFVSIAKANSVELAVQSIEEAFSTEVRTQLGGKIPSERFLPYFQLHELEALFFAEPEVLAETLEASGREAEFAKIVTDCRGCESINDSPNTAPSKRLEKVAPLYVKGGSEAAHAPRLGRKMDLSKIRQACPRFDRWLSRLEIGVDSLE